MKPYKVPDQPIYRAQLNITIKTSIELDIDEQILEVYPYMFKEAAKDVIRESRQNLGLAKLLFGQGINLDGHIKPGITVTGELVDWNPNHIQEHLQ